MKKSKRALALLLAVAVAVTSNTAVPNALVSAAELNTETAAEGENQAADAVTPEAEETTAVTPEVTQAVEKTAVPTDTEKADSSQDINAATADNAGQTPQVQAEAADVPAAKDGDTNVQTFEVSSKIDKDTVLAGDTFTFSINYKVPPASGDSKYRNMKITMELPDGLEVRKNELGLLDITGATSADVDDFVTPRVLTINMENPLEAGTSKSIEINFQTDNFVWTDQTKLELRADFDGALGGTSGSSTPVAVTTSASTIVTATDGWGVTKEASAVDSTTEDGYYLVPYTITTFNTMDDGNTESNYNRNGRLDLKEYLLTDILPTLQTSADGTGYPEGGGAVSIESIQMSGGGSQSDLVADEDYTLEKNADGSIKSVAIKKYAKVSEDQSYVDKGTPAPTTYTILVKYPRDKYVTPSNEETAKIYTLNNTAQLKYKLQGENERTDTDDANVQLGEKEAPGASMDLNVQKLASIAGIVQDMTNSTGTSFGLYVDEACTKPARNVDGTFAVGNAKEIDKNGAVSFAGLASGTYYLKETSVTTGWTKRSDPIQVTLNATAKSVELGDKTGTQVTLEKDGTVDVTNTTTQLGVVQFTKYGKDASGKVAILAGTKFELTDGTNTYTATSDSNGVVTFFAIPVGEYSLTETEVVDDQYDVDRVPRTVNVRANEINAPTLDNVNVDGEDTQGFLNVSPKGYLQITKVDSKDPSIKLMGAEFEVYGPFTDEASATKDSSKLVKVNGEVYHLTTGSNGIGKSIALEKGFYLLNETTAPESYAIIGDGTTVVEVKQNTINNAEDYKIENEPKVKFSIQKTGVLGDNTYTEPLYGVTFKIYDAMTGGNLLGTLTTKKDATGLAVTDPLLLAPGTYYYEESNTPAEYTAPTGRTPFEVSTADTTKELSVKNYTERGQIKIIKENSVTGEKLGDATFTVYSDEDCKTEVTTITTDENGVGLSDLLPAGNYWVKETKAPEGYHLSAEVTPVAVARDAQVEVPLTNDELTRIEITKTDSVQADKKLNGVVYEIYATEADAKLRANAIAKQTTKNVDGKDGVCVFEGLDPDRTYYVREKSTITGYVLDEAVYAITTAAGDAANKTTAKTLTNVRKGKLVVSKTTNMDAEPTKPMAGVSFTLYNYIENPVDGNHKGTVVKTADTDRTGMVSFDDLVPGDYILVESKLPDDATGAYDTLNQERKVTVSPGENQEGYDAETETVDNRANKGKLQIEKVDEADASKKVAATFQLYTDSNCNTEAKDASGQAVVLKTDATSGQATSGWLTPGTYYLKETVSDSNYTLDEQVRDVTIMAAQTNTTFTGEGAITNVKKGQLTINKKAEFAIAGSDGVATGGMQKYELQGAGFYLIPKTSAGMDADVTAASLKNPAATMDMTRQSTLTSEQVDAGDYWIVEYQCPAEYTMDRTKGTAKEFDGKTYYVWNTAVTVPSGDTAAADIDNTTDKGKLRLTKTGLETLLLDGAVFEVYKVDPNGTEYTIHGKTVKLSKAEVSASTGTDKSQMESGTDGDGSAVTKAIDPGTYYLKEIDTSKIEGGPWYWYDEWTGPIEVRAGNESQVTIDNYTMTGVGKKTDDKGKGLAGATFGVFKTQDEARTMAEYIESNNFSVINANPDASEEDEAKLKAYTDGLKDGSIFAKYGIIQTAVSQADGSFTFKGLVPNTEYYIVELMAPAGYSIGSDVKKVTVAADGNGFTTDLAFEDYHLGKLQVIKYTKLSDDAYKDAVTLYPVEGVNFAVYKATAVTDGSTTTYQKESTYYKKTSETAIATGTSGKDGLYTSILIPAGTYIVEETGVEDNCAVTIDQSRQNYRVVMVGQDGTTNSYYTGMADPDGAGYTVEGNGTLGNGFYNPVASGKFVIQKVKYGINDEGKEEQISDNKSTVTFKLQKKDGTTYKDYTLPSTGKATFTVTVGKVYLSDFLPVGDYRLFETSASGMTIAYPTTGEGLQFSIKGGKITGCKTAGVFFTGQKTDSAITTEAFADGPMVIKNMAQGNLKVQKVGVFGNQLVGVADGLVGSGTSDSELVNVRFELYKDAACTQLAPGKAFTITSGSGYTWNNIDAGTYWLKEVDLDDKGDATPNGDKYTLDQTPIRVVIESGKTTDLSGVDATTGTINAIKNTTKYGKLKIKKVDANNSEAVMANVSFTLYKNAACNEADQVKDLWGNTATITTGNDGVGTSKLIPAGTTYYLKENVPTGYAATTTGGVTGPYTVQENATTDLSTTEDSDKWITNKKTFTIEVTKKDGQTGKALGSAQIGLYATQADAGNDTNRLAVQSSDAATGKVTFTGLSLTSNKQDAKQSFWVREIATPDAGVYVLDTTPYEVSVSYTQVAAGTAGAITFTTATGEIVNNQKGSFKLKKTGNWQGILDNAKQPVSLGGAQFAIYKVSADQAKHADTDRPVKTITTSREAGTNLGIADSGRLDEGWYEIVETKAPDGYAINTDSHWVHVLNNTVDTTLVTDPIEDVPNAGRFFIQKYDGNTEGSTPVGNETPAEFQLEKKNADTGNWDIVDPDHPTFTVNQENFSYTSGPLAAGTYRVIETVAPTHRYTQNGTNYVIHFQKDTTPREFVVVNGKTVGVNEAAGTTFETSDQDRYAVYNSPKGSIQLTKTGYPDPFSTTTEVLEGAGFKLYSDSNCTEEVKDDQGTVLGTKTTNASGICTWTDINPGTYYIKEVETLAMEKLGYAINTEPLEVTIAANQLYNADLQVETSMTDDSDKGRICFVKTDENGTALGGNSETGAQFAIYAGDGLGGWKTTPEETVTIVSTGGTLSSMLPAERTGTQYKVVETRAPQGCTLDEHIDTLKRIVTVYPIHTPTVGATDTATDNVEIFTNHTTDSVVGFQNNELHKSISEDGTTYTDELTAQKSLLTDSYTANFKLNGYADGTNQVSAKTFTVTDNNITLYPAEKAGETTTAITPDPQDRDYKINSLTVGKATNKDGSTVGAKIFVQRTHGGEWEELTELELADVSTADQTVTLDGKAVGIKIAYTNVGIGFTSVDGIILNVTFTKRTWSTTSDKEVRKISNIGTIHIEDALADAEGDTTSGREVDLTSEERNIRIPAYVEEVPEVSIQNDITSTKTSYQSGDKIDYRITVENHNRIQEEFKAPVISVVMPAYTTLNKIKYPAGDSAKSGFVVYKVTADGDVIPLSEEAYGIVSATIKAPLTTDGNDNYTTSDMIDTEQYVITLQNTILQPGEKILVDFEGTINYEVKKGVVTTLVCPSYLGSTAVGPVSEENPKGTTFKPYDQKIVDNETIDDKLNENLDYLNATNQAPVGDATSLQIVKYIGTELDADGNPIYKPLGDSATVVPGEKIYYRLRILNNSTNYIDTARIVDILPAEGDTYVMPVGTDLTNRGTTIPETGEQVRMDATSPISFEARDDVTTTTYYTNTNWVADRIAGNINTEISEGGMLSALYYKDGDFSNWTTTNPADATAIAAEIKFADGLAPYATYDIYLTATAPGYTADEMADYYNKVMDNSAALAVLKKNDASTDNVIDVADHVEAPLVEASMSLPTGSIGDYVWLDTDRDGLQDADESPLDGVPVNLYKTTYYKDENGAIQSSENLEATATTTQDGKYLFENLACSFPKEEANRGSEDPSDYVGGKYYTYRVKFGLDGTTEYMVTKRYEGEDTSIDSNVDEKGYTDPVSLFITKEKDNNGNTTQLVADQDLTIDAGLVFLYSIGDYVWFDDNNNGIQDPSEQGVEGVTVNLYKAAAQNGGNPILVGTTTTDADGKYLFKDLDVGFYIVEFDISGLDKKEGYTQEYGFTGTQSGTTIVNTDSDAKHKVDGNELIMRTDVITLTKESLHAAGITDRQDLRWDAGLIKYSAIGGFAFDDKNYDNLHTTIMDEAGNVTYKGNIPLLGTEVELYLITNGERSEEPIATTTVDENGKYLFDKLTFAGESETYQIHFKYPEGYKGVTGNVGDDDTKDSDVVNYTDDIRSEGFTDVITLPKDTIDTTWDAGASKYSTIGDYVWQDYGGTDPDTMTDNGKQDPGEKPVEGVRVVLQYREDANSPWNYYGETVTDKDGLYLFTDLKSSDAITTEYRVVFALDAQTAIAKKDADGVSDALDSDASNTYSGNIIPPIGDYDSTGGFVTMEIKPGYGETDLTWDAGILEELSALGDYVWYDNEYDGKQGSATDLGVPDVTVVLEYNPSGDVNNETAWIKLGETKTDSTGHYLFDKLHSGYYRVKFKIPDGYTVTKYDQDGVKTDEDSDAMIQQTDKSWFATKTFYLGVGVTDLTWDAGIYKPKTRVKVETVNKTNTTYKKGATTTKRVTKTVTSKKAAKTGDETQTMLFWLLLLCSGGIVLTEYKKKRKSQNK